MVPPALVLQAQASFPVMLLPTDCADALTEFTCMASNLSCAHGVGLAPCRNVCLNVEQSCGWLVMSTGVRPAAPAGMFDCDNYPNATWPACASPIPPASWSSCPPPSSNAALSLPPPLPIAHPSSAPWNTCTVDGCGCSEGGRYDACGRCRDALPEGTWLEGSCIDLDTDPRTISYICIAAASLFCLLALCTVIAHVLLKRCSAVRRSLPSGNSEPGSSNDQLPGAGPRLQWRAVPVAFSRWQAKIFCRLGIRVAQRPWQTLAVTTAFACVAACGLSVIRVHRDALTMWLPSGSAAQVNAADYSILTGRPRPRSVVVLVDSAASVARAGAPPSTDDSSAQLKTALTQAIGLHELVSACGLSNVSAPTGLSDGVISPLLLWDYSRELLQRDPDPHATIRTALDGAGIDNGVTAGILRSMIRLSAVSGGSPEQLEALLLVYNLDGRPEGKGAAVAFERCARNALTTTGAPLNRVSVAAHGDIPPAHLMLLHSF